MERLCQDSSSKSVDGVARAANLVAQATSSGIEGMHEDTQL